LKEKIKENISPEDMTDSCYFEVAWILYTDDLDKFLNLIKHASIEEFLSIIHCVFSLTTRPIKIFRHLIVYHIDAIVDSIHPNTIIRFLELDTSVDNRMTQLEKIQILSKIMLAYKRMEDKDIVLYALTLPSCKLDLKSLLRVLFDYSKTKPVQWNESSICVKILTGDNSRCEKKNIVEPIKLFLSYGFGINKIPLKPLVRLINNYIHNKELHQLLTIFLQYGADPCKTNFENVSGKRYDNMGNSRIIDPNNSVDRTEKCALSSSKNPKATKMMETYIYLSIREEWDQEYDLQACSPLVDPLQTSDFTDHKILDLMSVTGFTNFQAIAYFGFHRLLTNNNDVDIKTMLGHQDSLGNTALHYAVEYSRSLETIWLLYDLGANFYIENNSGITPFDLLSYATMYFNTGEISKLIIAILSRDPSSQFYYLIPDLKRYLRLFFQ
jgi:hypothetical protein